MYVDIYALYLSSGTMRLPLGYRSLYARQRVAVSTLAKNPFRVLGATAAEMLHVLAREAGGPIDKSRVQWRFGVPR